MKILLFIAAMAALARPSAVSSEPAAASPDAVVAQAPTSHEGEALWFTRHLWMLA